MPYPAKISVESVLAAALDRLEAGGINALSMRTLASDLGVTAASLYRYIPDRATLETALAGEGARQLRAALIEATANQGPTEAIYSAARAYLEFARHRPALYDLIMQAHMGADDVPARMDAQAQRHDSLWRYVLDLMERLTGKPDNADAAVALWAYLHGFVILERAGIIGASPDKPASGFEAGLTALLAGFTAGADTASRRGIGGIPGESE